MERKTKVTSEDGRQDLLVTREFDLPVDLLFRAYSDPGIIEQWMGTKVLQHESKPHGSWRFETSDPQGNVVFQAHGVYHEFLPSRKITRTFEMSNAPFSVQLEFLEFEALTDETSTLSMHIVFRSVEHRNKMLKMPFAQGINMAHNRLEEVAAQLR